MSKFLKIIVNLVVIAAIAVAAALLVPPFAGVDTVMNDNTETDTNLPVGSVAYGRQANAGDLKTGDRIIYSEGSSDFVYEITDMDASAGVYKVKDPYNKNSDPENLSIQKSVPKVVLVVPFIGYAAIALQSTEGLIVVGLGIIFLIILFILSEIWRKDRDEEDEDEEDEEEETETEEEEEEVLSRRERRRMKKEEKRRRKLEKKGYIEEDEEEEEEETPAQPLEEIPELPDSEEALSSFAFEASEISGPEQVPDATVIMPDIQEIEEIPVDESPEEEKVEEIQEIPEEPLISEIPEIPESDEGLKEEVPESTGEEPEELVSETAADTTIIIPEVEEEEAAINPEAVPAAPSINELLAKAQAAGDAPEVKEDKDNQVTLLDYSDIL